MNHLKNSNITIKIEIIEKIQWIINRIHHNSFVLSHKTELKQTKSNISFSIINELIDVLFDNDKEELLRDNLINLLQRIVYYSGLKEEYLIYVFRKITSLFYNYDGNKFHIMLKLLNVLEKFFYFFKFSFQFFKLVKINNIVFRNSLQNHCMMESVFLRNIFTLTI